ncbi:hypothetical protein MES5069_110110 [Mesorhizobium escarrei]|uniref:Uncharacterized protein n=1 Tax=Mesorhizobium escarrei TaxID=666018 RepID=A0ABN8JBU9_9HYPH|nr:hypothetical protein MES5069_110110 [Mesorhizobium escarrei]
MLRNPPHQRLKINVAEQLARPIVAAAHASSPNLFRETSRLSQKSHTADDILRSLRGAAR